MKKVEEYINLPYAAFVTPDEGTDGKSYYRAEHPQLPGCMSHGSTREEALQNLAEARHLYIQTCIDMGREIPVPLVTTIRTFSSDCSYTLVPEKICWAVAEVESTLPSMVDMASEAA
jgi:predicted RNase H-like HicB family nuclease